ncbi:hypothetical protein QBC41DRAFT_385020 [Cercophora samala]|uniref:Uncharacterized protein n=1 Tax=Cercophora samala TaxID=330535 RepID=A0AA39YUB1_9PEZI|nr:hypothetical protein QBC41DRAFT_385020 [Cercophora samala]
MPQEDQFWLISPITLVLLVSSIITLMTIFFAMAALLADFVQKVERAESHFQAQQTEFSVLQRVLRECEHILDGPVDAPDHVLEALETCRRQGVGYDDHSYKLQQNARSFKRFPMGQNLRIYYKQTELDKSLAAYKGSVLLLRDLCSEIKLRQQLVEMSAAMAKLSALAIPDLGQTDFDSVYEASIDDDSSPLMSGALITKNPNNLALVHQSNHAKLVEQVWRQGFSHLSAEKYNIDAAIRIIVDQPQAKHPGQAFKYYPARVKLDSASDVDLVSISYLRQAGALEHVTLVDIPEDMQIVIRGVGNGSLIPSHRVILEWCGHGESKIHEGWFDVVDFPDIDILLGTASFEKIAVARVARAWPIIGRRKPKALSDREYAQEEESLARARESQIAEFERKLAERRRDQLALGRAETIISDEMGTKHKQDLDLELGPNT